MSTKPAVLSTPQVLTLPKFIHNSQYLTVGCLLLTDFFALSAVFGAAIVIRNLITPSYRLGSLVALSPCLAILVVAFAIQGLYPGVLLHPAEEMRRIFLATTTVFLIVGSATFLWRNGEAYSRSVFLATWFIGPPLVFLARHVLRHLLANQQWWGITAVVLGSQGKAQRLLRTLSNPRLGVRVKGVFCDAPIDPWPPDLPPLLGPLS